MSDLQWAFKWYLVIVAFMLSSCAPVKYIDCGGRHVEPLLPPCSAGLYGPCEKLP